MNDYLCNATSSAAVDHLALEASVTTVEMRRAWIEVDLSKIVHNACLLLRAANSAGLLAVVKADAYGIGATYAARALSQVNPWGFAVATIDEGIKLRKDGIVERILVFQPAHLKDCHYYSHYSLIATIDRPDLVGRWPTEFHVAIDTGMCREGIPWTDKTIDNLDWKRATGIFTHLHAADICRESVLLQCHRFHACLEKIPARSHLVKHVVNSAGVWQAEECFDLIRPGIFLYGGVPGDGLPIPEPVITVKSRITSLRSIKAGDTVGYGFDHHAKRDTTIATVSIGYADGIPWKLSNATVLVNGERCQIVGRVTMDMVMVDVGLCSRQPFIGQSVILIGRDLHGQITLNEFASWAQTLPYEVLARLSPRLPRVYGN